MASDFAITPAAAIIGDVCRRRTAVLARAVGDALGACGVFVVGWGADPRVVGSEAKECKGPWLRKKRWWAGLWQFGQQYQRRKRVVISREYTEQASNRRWSLRVPLSAMEAVVRWERRGIQHNRNFAADEVS